jgi:transposase, IS6 family
VTKAQKVRGTVSVWTSRLQAKLWFRSVDGALITVVGYEAMHMVTKGQVRWLAKGDVVGRCRFIHTLFGGNRI